MASSKRCVMLAYLFLIKYVNGVKLKDLIVPSPIAASGPALLSCVFDLEGSPLYSIKWYKDKEEFYRYVPRENPPVKIFDTGGIDIDLTKTNEGNVYLKNINLKTAGVYRCEVSGESPFFQTHVKQKRMVVHVYPKHRPKISGTRYNYNSGDMVDVSCSTESSKPPATITWFINGVKADDRFVTKIPGRKDKDGLMSSRSNLRFKVNEDDIRTGRLALKCLGVIGKRYNKSRETSAVEGYRQSSVLLISEHSETGQSTNFLSSSFEHLIILEIFLVEIG
ncbi:hypothetical protein GQR58_002789 [Nymphon striatum]|nr:hypothetical protein GQR58_002789 [Nymphon striatum]